MSRTFTLVRRASGLLVLALLLTGALASAGSAGEEGGSWAFITEESDDPMLPGVNPLEVQGNIVTAGSSTMFPLAERMVERFKDEGFPGNITVDSIGSGAGFERFCTTGEIDISNASRAIKAKEVDACRAIGREPIEVRVGTDALAVVVSKGNTFADNVDLAQLAALFSTAAKPLPTGATSIRHGRMSRSSASSPAPTAGPSTTSWKRCSTRTRSRF